MTVYDPSVPRPPAIPDPDDLNPPIAVPFWTRVGRIVLTALGGVAYLLGWLTAAILVPVIDSARWVFSAVALGWDDAANDWRADERK